MAIIKVDGSDSSALQPRESPLATEQDLNNTTIQDVYDNQDSNIPTIDVGSASLTKFTIGDSSGASSGAFEVGEWNGSTYSANLIINEDGSIITDSGATLSLGNFTPDAASALQVDSTTQGVLVPRMTTTQRDNISTPPEGLMIYNSTSGRFEFYDSAAWSAIGGSGEVASYAKWKRTSSQSISSGANTVVTWNSADLDTDSYTATADEFNVPTSGVYELTTIIRWSGIPSSNGRLEVSIRENGTEEAFTRMPISTAEDTIMPTLVVSYIADAPFDTYSYDVQVFQNTGASLSILADSAFWIKRIKDTS